MTVTTEQLTTLKEDASKASNSIKKYSTLLVSMTAENEVLKKALWIIIPIIAVICLILGGFAGYGIYYEVENIKKYA